MRVTIIIERRNSAPEYESWTSLVGYNFIFFPEFLLYLQTPLVCLSSQPCNIGAHGNRRLFQSLYLLLATIGLQISPIMHSVCSFLTVLQFRFQNSNISIAYSTKLHKLRGRVLVLLDASSSYNLLPPLSTSSFSILKSLHRAVKAYDKIELLGTANNPRLQASGLYTVVETSIPAILPRNCIF